MVEALHHACRNDSLWPHKGLTNGYQLSLIGPANHIGQRLLAGFKKLGDYHIIFWNCQLFAKLLLRLICQDSERINFGALTSAEATRLVTQTYVCESNPKALCAIVIPSPVATTQWHKEMAKTSELVKSMLKQSDAVTEDELATISEQGVNYIVYSALTDPHNEAQIEMLVEPKRGTFLFWKISDCKICFSSYYD